MKIIWALCLRNLKDFVRNKTRLVFSIIFPFFFIWIFSSIFQSEALEDPISYMLAGIAIATVFDVTLRISSSTITDMASGFMKEVLVSPIRRIYVAIGQFLSGAIIGTLHGVIILIGGFLLGYRITQAITVLYILLAMVFIGLVFAGFGLFLATKAKNAQTFQVISMAITMPMTFISGAYINLGSLPDTLQVVGRFNPLSYAVALFRTISLELLDAPAETLLAMELTIDVFGVYVTPFMSILVLLGFGVLFLLLATLSFSRTDFSKMSRNAGDYVDW